MSCGSHTCPHVLGTFTHSGDDAALRKLKGKVSVREKGGWGWRVRVQGKDRLVSLCGVSFFFAVGVHFWPT